MKYLPRLLSGLAPINILGSYGLIGFIIILQHITDSCIIIPEAG